MYPTILSQCDTEIEALNIKDALATNGIESTIESSEVYDTFTAQVAGKRTIYAIFVDKTDITKAKSIVAKLRQEQKEQLPWCPNCGEDNVEKVGQLHFKISKKWYISICATLFIVFIVLLFFKPDFAIVLFIAATFVSLYGLKNGYNKVLYRCRKCGHTWSQIV